MAKRRRSGGGPARSSRPAARAQVVQKGGVPAIAPRTPEVIQGSLADEGMDSSATFGPGRPLNPYLGYSQQPRRMDFPVGVNISTRTRQTWDRPAFETLQAIIDAYDVARMCINHKIDELRSMEPLFVPAEGVRGDVEDAITAARQVLEFPDRELPYLDWLSKLLENALRYDAAPLYRRRNLGGDVIGLEVIDGTTILPFVDAHGRRPRPPAPAFYQVVHGQPWSWFTSEDIDYRMFRPQSNAPFGLAPIESILLTANTDLRFQWHFLQMFTEGSVPAGFIELPPDVSSPDQVAEWQDYWDAMIQGDQAKLHQLVAVPAGTKVTGTKPESFDSSFPEYLMSRTCAAYGVTPQDIGLVKDVNRANGETQVDIQFRVNTLPWVRWVEGILSRYLKYDVGLPVAVKLDTGRDKEDRLAEAQAWQIYVDSGAASVDEMREELLGLPVDNERRVPRFINTKRLGPVPLTSIEAIAGPVDAESLSPTDAAPLAETPFDGAPALVPDKLPGGQVFTRAQINPDEPSFPGLQVPHPDTGVVAPPAAPVAKDATAGVTSATGITGSPLAGSEEDDEVKVAKAAEVASFRRFAKARARAGRWRDFSFEVHDGVEAHRLNDAGRLEVRKAAGLIGVAGLAVLAADSGRVLMLQRALDPSDDAAGMWEFPGGHLEDGESPLDAARREWQEEVGCLLPAGEVTGVWDGANGIYRGFVYRIGGEGLLDVAGRGQVNNPDDPDGDVVEAIAWWAPALLPGNPALRVELAASIDAVLSALAPVDGEGLEVAKAASGSGPKA